MTEADTITYEFPGTSGRKPTAPQTKSTWPDTPPGGYDWMP